MSGIFIVKMGIFLFVFVLFKQFFTVKMLASGGFKLRVEGEHTDH